MKICVLSRATRGGYDPRVFHLGQRRLPVVAVLKQWTDAGHRYFDVRVEDGRHFVLRHDPATGVWELAAAYGGGKVSGRRVPAAVVRL